MAFDIPSGKTVGVTDEFTIEMDWGEDPEKMTGNLVEASEAEYAVFKTHMVSQIANVLTPIEEEEEQ